MAANMEQTIESRLNQILGKSADQAIDLPEWATPMIMGVIEMAAARASAGQ